MEMSQSKENYVPFVSEVEEFNATMGKPNNYTPNIPDEKEWMLRCMPWRVDVQAYGFSCGQFSSQYFFTASAASFSVA